MNTSALHVHKTWLGYLLSLIRAGRIWKWITDAAKYVRRARLMRLLYRILRALFFFVETGATAAVLVAALVALIPLLLVFASILLVDHILTCLRWRTVLQVVFSFERRCYVYFCERLPRNAFLLANATSLAQSGALVFVVVPFRANDIRFRNVERINSNLFLLKPDFYFYICRRFLQKNKKNIAFVLSDFDISKGYYTTKVEGMSR